MCNLSKHNNIIQYVNIENMGEHKHMHIQTIKQNMHTIFVKKNFVIFKSFHEI
jgi:hypothetical protein